MEKFEKRSSNFKKKIEKLSIKFVCNYCFKLIDSQNVHWKILDIDGLNKWLKNSLIIKAAKLRKNEKFCFCKSCSQNISQNLQINKFTNFCAIPEELKEIKNYFQINQISICTLYCRTFQPTNYAYWHFNGKININHKQADHLRDTFGAIFDEKIDESLNSVNNNRVLVKRALIWLKKNNPFYLQYFANGEVLDSYFNKNNNLTETAGFPTVSSKTIVFNNRRLI